jgi:hypothetical protein
MTDQETELLPGHEAVPCAPRFRIQIQIQVRTAGTTPHPRRASASAPPEGRKEEGQRRATRDEGGKKSLIEGHELNMQILKSSRTVSEIHSYQLHRAGKVFRDGAVVPFE